MNISKKILNLDLALQIYQSLFFKYFMSYFYHIIVATIWDDILLR